MKTVAYSLLTLLIIVGCTHTITETDTTNTSSMHGNKSTELRTLMHKFDNLLYQHYDSELDRDRRRINYTKDMIGIVDELVEDSKKIKSLPPKNLSKAQIRGFLVFAEALEIKSKELKEMVKEYQAEEIPLVLNELNRICIKCHATVR